MTRTGRKGKQWQKDRTVEGLVSHSKTSFIWHCTTKKSGGEEGGGHTRLSKLTTLHSPSVDTRRV